MEMIKEEKPKSTFYFVWKKLRRNRLAMAGLGVICMTIVMAVLGYLIMPDSTPMANEMSLQLSMRKPGFSVQMIQIHKNSEVASRNFFSTMLFGRESEYKGYPIVEYHFEGDEIVFEEFSGLPGRKGEIHREKIADVVYPLSIENPKIKVEEDRVSFVDFHGKAVTASLAELKKKIEKENIVTRRFILGTDRFGRDMLSRLIAGTRVSLSVGLISVAISLLIGVALGAIAGFFRGWVDSLVMWLINVVWSIPTLLMVIAITLAIGKGFWQVFVAVGLTMWVEVARMVRGQIFSIREMEFVEAGRALGFHNRRIIVKHILPNIMGPIIVISAANFASAILLEAGLSFLGLGAQPPTPSWGVMIKENYGYIIVDAAYLAILPGIAIMVMVLAFNLLGNGLRDAFDTRDSMGMKRTSGGI